MAFINPYDALRLDPDGNCNQLPWATDEQYSVLPSPAVTLVAFTSYGFDSHYIAVATRRNDKVRILMDTPSNSFKAASSVVMIIDDEPYAIGNRDAALSWFGYRPRTHDEMLIDADGLEYIEVPA